MRFRFFLPILFITGSINAQLAFRGIVKDKKSKPVSGVVVAIWGVTPSPPTNDMGQFEIKLPNSSDYVAGAAIRLSVKKEGWSIIDEDDLIKYIPLEAKSICSIRMSKDSERESELKRTEDNIVRKINTSADEQIIKLQQKLKIPEYSSDSINLLKKEIENIKFEREETVKWAKKIANQLYKIDLSLADSTYSYAHTLFERGLINEAKKVLKSADLKEKKQKIEEEEKQHKVRIEELLKCRKQISLTYLLQARIAISELDFESAEQAYDSSFDADSTNFGCVIEFTDFLYKTNKIDKAIYFGERIVFLLKQLANKKSVSSILWEEAINTLSIIGRYKDKTLNVTRIVINDYSLEGFIFDQSTGLPLGDTKVTLIACDSTKNETFTTDASGKFTFKLDTGCCFKVRGEKNKYFAVTTPDTICTKGITESKTYEVKLNLQPTTVNSNNPTDGGQIADGGTGGLNPDGRPKKGGTGNGLNPDGTPVKGGSSSVGKFGDITYIDPEVVYDSKKGIYTKNGKPFIGTSDGVKYKKGKPVDGGNKTTANPNAVAYDQTSQLYMKKGKPFTGKDKGTEYKDGVIVGGSGFQPASTVHTDKPEVQAYLLHIYYDFDQSNIRDESKTDLDKLLKLMQDNPTYIVELASHTDARGSNSYNYRLSQRRAEAVVRWLIDKGIDRTRLVPRGYGEGMTANRCKNAIPCTEQEHQMNRRTEFRVLGCTGCVDDAKKVLSSPNENAKVDKCKNCPF